MIISRTPLRVSFAGGGSDLPAFYKHFPGAVVSTAINRYVYVTVNRKFDDRIRVSYSRTEDASSVSKIRHPLVRVALKKLNLTGGIEITSIADIPSKGSGLGSSSSFTVGLLNALYAYQNRHCPAEQLAKESCEIEQGGKQDQYAAAFGGLNFIQFRPDGSVTVEPIICQPETIRELQANLLVFYTGITRKAGNILKRKQREISTDAVRNIVLQMTVIARHLRSELQQNNLQAFGPLLHQNWMLKKRICSHVSSPQIDRWYDTARHHGAIGGKLLGAGTGGFLLFYAPQWHHKAIKRALALRSIPISFESQGSKIIFVH